MADTSTLAEPFPPAGSKINQLARAEADPLKKLCVGRVLLECVLGVKLYVSGENVDGMFWGR